MSGREVLDSPTEWVADHIHRYVKSAGEDGDMWRGVPTLPLTTVGRKTGLGRRTALIYGTDGDDYIVVASKGGHPTHPLWFENLVVEPIVDVQVGSEVFSARASVISDESRYQKLWVQMVGIWPGFDEYKTKTTRVIPLVALTPQ
ncbi:MAG: nitroreductase family deazaflavin-dependent oxidoreductase [Actinobacteria bacterium]|jgi:deazaflavin-dependent oxidoreductase (nitroreductase family)|nr:nitroreductase family deazaflavin-dependent oxidoreductase [Actinomycetota bacterium]